jgi:sugar lactone lactonase YvrE
MKKILLASALAAAAAVAAHAESHTLEKLWETEAALKVPESVLYDAARKVLYVSNIDGESWTADGKGSIAKVGLDGKIIAAEWITGLDCPKGLALAGDKLYVGDAKGLIVIDVEKGSIVDTIKIDGAVGLNDVASDGHGTLYVSDMKAKKVHAVKDGKATTVLENLDNPNGVLFHQGALYVLDKDALHRVEENDSLKTIATGMPGGVDGVEALAGGDFLVSVWSGALWYIQADGTKQLLFDGKAEKTSTADIGWDPATRTVYVPTFGKNTVIAFKVE